MLRATTATTRMSSRVPALLSTQRLYTGTDGAIRSSPGTFSRCEKAVEDQYIHNQEVERLRALRAQLEEMNKEVQASKDRIEAAIKKTEENK